jgi:hypothetical protein
VGGCFELAVGDAAVEILANVINFSVGSSAYKKLAQWEPALKTLLREIPQLRLLPKQVLASMPA